MKVILARTILGISMILLSLTSSCQTKIINQKGYELQRYLATAKDFPPSWVLNSEDWNNDSGNESYSASYGLPNIDFIGFGQTISMYPNQTQAQNAYSVSENKWFTVTKKWPGAEFTPLDANDMYRYECLQILPDKSIVSCGFLQRHKELVIIILANLDGKAMTFDQLNNIFQIIDKRLNVVSLENQENLVLSLGAGLRPRQGLNIEKNE